MARGFTFIPVGFATLWLAACGSGSPFPTTPTTPPVSVSQTFSGRLALNGARTHDFTATRGGEVRATLTSVSPQGAIIGLSLGEWSTITSTCTTRISRDDAPQGTTIVAQAGTPGAFCARVYDSTGDLPQAVHYEVEVTYYVDPE